MNDKKHNAHVNEFLRQIKEADKKYYDDICKKYPTLTPRRWQSVHEHEIPYSAAERDNLFGTDDVFEEGQ